MNLMINTKGLKCDKCGIALENEKIVVENSISQHFCRDCAKEADQPDLYTYADIGEGESVLVLDHSTYDAISKKAGNNISCRNIIDYDGPIDNLSIEKNAIIIVELRKERPYPQQKLIDAHKDLARAVMAVQFSQSQCMTHNAKSTDRTFFFCRTDDEQQTHKNLCEIFRMVKQIDPERKRRLYMERSSRDTNDLARLLLADSGFNCVYCSGERKETKNAETSFAIDFTFEELYDYCRSRIIGQDKELRTATFLVYDYLEKVSLGMKTPALNWLLTAPSGMGKTEFYRAVHDFIKAHNIPLPVVQIDLSQITETGFKGKDADNILGVIFNNMTKKGAYLPSGAAICFLDEADKKCTPSYDSHGKDVNAAVQANLLTMIEGIVTDVPDEDSKFDTSNTMFVFMGAFQDLRDKRKENGDALHRIFSDDDTEDLENCFYDDIKLDDLITYGMLEELAGRITMSVNFHKLPEDEMRRLLKVKAEQFGKDYGVCVELSPQAADDLIAIAYTNLGVRAPLNKITELVIEALSERRIKSGYDSDREIIVLTSGTRAEIKRKGKVKLSEAM